MKKLPVSPFTLGRNDFAKISEIEGMQLTPSMIDLFKTFDQKGLSAVERRNEIVKRYLKAR